MNPGWLDATLTWVIAHPLLASGAVFAVALAESLFLFGLLVPGALLMFVAGALVGAGALELIPTLIWAMAGALAGDTISFALGRAYRGDLQRIRLLRRLPNLTARGEVFFREHGGKGIILGRFVGALRPIMPTIAGAAGMRTSLFLLVDIIAAIGWSLCYILPGVVFGASLELAAQVAGRLAALLLVSAAALWLLLWTGRWLIATGSAWGRHHTERLLDWSRRHRILGQLGPALADPRQPETPALVLLSLALGGITWAAYALVWGLDAPHSPTRLDVLVFHLVEKLHTPWSDFVALSLAHLGSPMIYAPLAAALLVGLLLLGNRRAAAHFFAGVLFAGTVALALRWRMAVESPVSYFSAATASGLTGGHLIVAGTIYGFLGAILAARRSAAIRKLYYSGLITLIALIGLSRLYLGLDWLTDTLIGFGVAFIWVSILTLGYRRQRPRPVRPRIMFACLAAALTAAVVWQAAVQFGAQAPNSPDRSGPRQHIEAWANGGFGELPAYTIDLAGQPGTPLNLQAAGELDRLTKRLVRTGWQTAARPRLTNLLYWLSPQTPIAERPVLPLAHNGRAPVRTLVHVIDRDSQLILRLWPSRFVEARSGRPLWIGQVIRQDIRRLAGILWLPDQTGGYDVARTLLSAGLDMPTALVRHPQARIETNWDGRVLLLAPLPTGDSMNRFRTDTHPGTHSNESPQ